MRLGLARAEGWHISASLMQKYLSLLVRNSERARSDSWLGKSTILSLCTPTGRKAAGVKYRRENIKLGRLRVDDKLLTHGLRVSSPGIAEKQVNQLA